MDMKARMSPHPGLNLGMLVGSVIIDDQVQIHFRRGFKVDCFKKPDKLLMPMSRHAVTYNSSIKRHHRGKKSRCAVPLVIMRHRAAAAFLQRQTWLSSVQSLNLRFLINAQHERSIRGIEVQADNIVKLLNKLLVPAQFEGLSQMRFELMLPPDSPNGSFTHTLSFGHRSGTPVSRIWWLAMQCRLDNPPDFSIGNFGKATWARRILLKPAQTESKKPLSPKLHGRTRNTKRFRYFLAWYSAGGHLNYLGALNDAGRHGSALGPHSQSVCFSWRKHNGSCSSDHEQHHTLF